VAEIRSRWSLLSAEEQIRLVDRIRSGGPAAGDEFVTIFGERIRVMMIVRVRDEQTAQELTQDALLASWRAIRDGRLREATRLGAFVHGTARNVVNNFIRSNIDRPQMQSLGDAADALPAPPAADDREQRALVAKALERLSAEDRRVLQMTLGEGLQPREIASSLWLSGEVVRTRKRRALERVREIIAELSRSPRDDHQRTMPADCDRFLAEEVPERYLTGVLTDADRDAYEEHFFTCNRCFGELQTMRALRAELRDRALMEGPSPVRRIVKPVWAWTAAAAALILAAAALFVVARIRTVPDRTAETTPTHPAGADAGVTDRTATKIDELTRVDPPKYIAMTLRSVDRSRAVFDEAMTAYTDGRYPDAIRGLEAFHSSHPSEATASFYLGVSLLMMNRNNEAIVALHAAERDSSYAGDARFLLTKALLRTGEREAALRLLDTIARANGPRAADARGLQRAVTALPPQ
jgi:RNA polymerase sigma-70 factor (ECF subfamily)